MILFIIRENGINQIFQKFIWKPQLVCYVSSFMGMTLLTLKWRPIIPKLHNFITECNKNFACFFSLFGTFKLEIWKSWVSYLLWYNFHASEPPFRAQHPTFEQLVNNFMFKTSAILLNIMWIFSTFLGWLNTFKIFLVTV